MPAEQDVLREYLISLGFRTDSAANQKFGERITDLDKKATALSRALAGVAITAATMSAEFAFRMERLYYSSKLAQSSAGNLQALDFAGKQAGIKDFTSMVLSLAHNIRSNPGLVGLINSLGVKVEGRDMGDVALDLAAALNKMPPFIAQRFGSMFGWDADDLYLMRDGLKTIREQAEQRKQLARDLGIDTEKAAESGKELAQQWRSVLMYAGLFKDALILEMLPAMRDLGGATQQVLADWVKIIKMPRDKFIEDLRVGLGLPSGKDEGAVELSPDARKRLGADNTLYAAPPGNKGLGKWLEDLLNYRERARRKKLGLPDPMDEAAVDATTAPDRKAIERESKLKGDPALMRQYNDAVARGDYGLAGEIVRKIDAMQAPAPTAPQPTGIPPTKGDRQSHLRDLEKQYALSPGLLDFVWQRESARGQAMLSPAGAKGHMGFMPTTAAAYGIAGRENDFEASTDAAGHMFNDLLRKYGGDMRFALAAYNWGSGKLDRSLMKTMGKHPDWSQEEVDRHVLANLPRETQDYISAAEKAGIVMRAETTINVHGVENPREVAREVTEQQQRVYSDIVRNNRQRLQ